MTISMTRVHKDCQNEQYKAHPFCNGLDVTGRFFQIANLVHGSELLEATEAQAPCLQCIIMGDSKANNSFDNLSKWLDTMDMVSQCSELQLGQEKTVFPLRDKSFNLKREADGSYSIPLNLQFSAADDYDGDVPKDQVLEYYMKTVRECLDKANPKMLGPKGEQLKVVIPDLIKQTENNCDDDVIKITIGSETHRSTPSKFGSYTDCDMITHEILHLLGLCDEYRERIRGFYVDSKTGKQQFTKDMSGEEYRKFAKDERYYFKPAYDCRAITNSGIMSDAALAWSNVINKNEGDSLLTNGQFNAILYGSCDSRNKLFNECSQLAYQSSLSDTDCLQKKHQCEIQNFSGANKQTEIRYIRQLMQENQKKRQAWEKPDSAKEYNNNSRLKKSLKLSYEQILNELRRESQYLEKRLKIVNSWP